MPPLSFKERQPGVLLQLADAAARRFSARGGCSSYLIHAAISDQQMRIGRLTVEQPNKATPTILQDAHLAPCQSHKAGIHQLIDQRRLFGRQSFSQQLVRRAYAHTAIANKKYTGSGGRKEGCTAEELSGIVVDYASSKLGRRRAF